MFKHSLPQLGRNEAIIMLEQHHSWINGLNADMWLGNIAMRYQDACEKNGIESDSTMWNTPYQNLLERQFQDVAESKKFVEVFQEAFLQQVQALHSQLSLQSFDGGAWTQLGCARSSASFVLRGMFIVVWPLPALARVFCEGYTVAGQRTNAPFVMWMNYKGLAYTASTICPTMPYLGKPISSTSYSVSRGLDPKKCLLRKGLDGRWYAVMAHELVSLWSPGGYVYGVCHSGDPHDERLSTVAATIPADLPDVLQTLRQKKVACRQLIKIIPFLTNQEHQRQCLIEFIARFCKNLYLMMISKDRVMQSDAVMHGNRMMASIGDAIPFRSIIMNICTTRFPDILKFLDLITVDDALVIMGRFQVLAALRVSTNGQVVAVEGRHHVSLRPAEVVVFKECHIDVDAVLAEENPHPMDLVEAIHEALVKHNWESVAALWTKIVASKLSPGNIAKVYESVCLVMQPVLRSEKVPMKLVMWYNDVAKERLPHHSPEAVLSADILAEYSLKNNKKVYAMLCYEGIMNDIIDAKTDEAFFHPTSKECILHFFDACEAVSTAGMLVGGLSFKTRSMLGSFERVFQAVMTCLEDAISRSTAKGKDLAFGIELVLTAAGCGNRIKPLYCSHMIARAKVLLAHLRSATYNTTVPVEEVDALETRLMEIDEVRENALRHYAAVKIQRHYRCAVLWRERQLRMSKVLQRIIRALHVREQVWEMFRPVCEQRYCQVQRMGRAYTCRVRFLHKEMQNLKQWRLWWKSQKIIEGALRVWVVKSSTARFALQKFGRGYLDRCRVGRLYLGTRSNFYIQQIQPQGRGYLGRLEMYWLWRYVLARRIQAAGRAKHVRDMLRMRKAARQEMQQRAMERVALQMGKARDRARHQIYLKHLVRVWHGFRSRCLDMGEAIHNRKLGEYVERQQKEFASQRIARVFMKHRKNVLEALILIQRAGKGLKWRKFVSQLLYKRKYRETMLKNLLDRVKRHEENLAAVRYHKHYHFNGVCADESHNHHNHHHGSGGIRSPTSSIAAAPTTSTICPQLTERQKELLRLSQQAAKVVREVQAVQVEVVHHQHEPQQHATQQQNSTTNNIEQVRSALDQIRAKNATLRGEIIALERAAAAGGRRGHQQGRGGIAQQQPQQNRSNFIPIIPSPPPRVQPASLGVNHGAAGREGFEKLKKVLM